MKINISDGNTKVAKTRREGFKALSFGIPANHAFLHDGKALNTCPGRGKCVSVCYALQGRFVIGAAARTRLENLAAALSPDFAPSMVAVLRTFEGRGFNALRVHDSGDFFAQFYVDAWATIAAAMPGWTFYAYTKSHRLDFASFPANFRLAQSLGGRFDKLADLSRPHARIFPDESALDAAGYVNGGHDDFAVVDGLVSIGLPYHGSRKMTAAQKKAFRWGRGGGRRPAVASGAAPGRRRRRPRRWSRRPRAAPWGR